jgi:hypothetical protein
MGCLRCAVLSIRNIGTFARQSGPQLHEKYLSKTKIEMPRKMQVEAHVGFPDVDVHDVEVDMRWV